MRNLSSSWTGFYKLWFPLLWIGVFGAGTLALFVSFSRFPGRTPAYDPRLLFLVILIVGGVFLLWYSRNLKTVQLDGSHFVITDADSEVRVPLEEVVRVTGTRFVHPDLIWLHIQRPGEMEQKVMFMPPIRLVTWGSRHPLVQELNELIGKGRGPLAG